MRLRWRRANVILVKTGVNRYLASFVTSKTPNGVYMNWDRFLPLGVAGGYSRKPLTGFILSPTGRHRARIEPNGRNRATARAYAAPRGRDSRAKEEI